MPSLQSTGAAGVYFEQHVAAFFLGLLLVRGTPPALKSCRLEALHLQARHLGWHTDDLLLVATETGGGMRHLAAQVKRAAGVAAGVGLRPGSGLASMQGFGRGQMSRREKRPGSEAGTAAGGGS